MDNNTLKIMFSKNTDHWATPSNIYKWFMENGYYDPCPLRSQVDNLNKITLYQKIYINPPYSNINGWVDYAITHINNGSKVVMLIPARTDTKYFHKALPYFNVIFIKGRLRFNDAGTAPFPSIFLVSKNNNENIIDSLK